MTQPSAPVHKLLMVLILALSAFIQLSVVSRTIVDRPLRTDAIDYFSYAWNLQHYGVYSAQRTWPPFAAPAPGAVVPDKLRTPGYPAFLLAVGKPTPDWNFLLRVSYMQAALSVVTVLLTYLLGCHFLPRSLALVGALIVAISPHMAIMSTYLLTETLFTTTLAASVLSLVAAVKSGRRSLFVATGLLWGVASLVRPTALYFPPMLLLVVIASQSLRHFARPAFLSFACFLAVLAPWVARNQSAALSGPAPSLMVNTLAHGSYPDFKYNGRPETYGYPYKYDPRIQAITQDLPSVFRDIAARFEAEPVRYTVWYLFGKPRAFLSWSNIDGFDVTVYPVTSSPIYEDRTFVVFRLVSFLLHWPLMLLALATSMWLAASAMARKTQPANAKFIAAFVTASVFLYAIVFHIAAAPYPRYAIPFRPMAYLLALLGVRTAWLAVRRMRNRPKSTLSPTHAVISGQVLPVGAL